MDTDQKRLIHYLLGHLSEPEQVEVEDRAFADAGYLGALEAAEADLIDAYVRGELPAADRRAFEIRFLASPQRRGKVEFARALAQVTAEFTPAVAARPSAWQSFLALLRGWNAGLQLAAALVVLVCVVGLTWLVSGSMAMRSRMLALQNQQNRLSQQEQALRRQLGEEQDRNRSLAAELERKQSQGSVPPVASLILLPGLSRAESTRKQLLLSASAPLAHIEIQLEARDEYPKFRAELRTSRGEEVVILSNLSRQRTASGHSIAFDVPTSSLRGGDYELTLKGLAANRPAEEIGYYYFTVQRK